MTHKEYERERKSFIDRRTTNGYGFPANTSKKLPVLYYAEEEILSCISMVDSILCYDCRGFSDASAVLSYSKRSYKDYLKEYVESLGENMVLKIIQEQIDSIDHIKCDVYTDSEGVSYNSIVWKDEAKEII